MRLRAEDRPQAARTRGIAVSCAVVAVVGLVAAASVAPAVPRTQRAPVRTVVVRDPVDTAGGLDLTRVQLGRASDGRLRAALTLAAPWRMADLPASDGGVPGSICLRMWTATKGQASFPDRVLCITADARGRHMTGTVMTERDGELQRVAGATLARSSDRTVVARFSQSVIGRPASVRFAGEATPPGCDRVTCIDTAPNAPTVATLTLRSS